MAIVLSFIHELAGPNLAGQPVVQVVWTLLHAYALALVLRFRLLAPLLNTWRHRLRVVAVTPEADRVVSVLMRGRHLDELGAEAGQFFRWRFLTRSTWFASYPFSLSAPPTNDRLRITIKALGLGTRLLHDLHPGTVVLAEGPYGALTERRRRRPRVLLVAGGVGITPMRALFETLDLPGEDLTLVYRAQSEEAVLFRKELDEIAERKGARVIYLIGSSDRPENLLNAYTLRAMVGPLREYDIYLCAPPRMAARLRESLRHTGHSRRQLHEEQFTF
jgi:ferredoxin-NADP reductase